MTPARAPRPTDAMSEEDLLRAVVDLAQFLGIRVHHCRPSQRADGSWETAIMGDKGFPDLALAGKNGVLLRELKSAKGRTSTDQVAWIDRLALAGADVGLWRPADWPDRIRAELQAIR